MGADLTSAECYLDWSASSPPPPPFDPVKSGDTSLQYVAVAFFLSHLKDSSSYFSFYAYNTCNWSKVIKCGHAQSTLKQGVYQYVTADDNNRNGLRQVATLHKQLF
jgi:hypothetical protein